ncbi:hypothetical protein QQZ08_004615 [Neonectria magnoliae]|uniref:Zn(2)-C6 fungal-type domain-containing protein n=1 Tax=Neonectria magnoliae TaxID=2732573 RepID=A0ABR1I5U0_9HYPO
MAESVTKLKWTRARAPRVKTGIRHLKCDEGKPTCQRCHKDKLTCDGYATAVTRRPKYKPIVRPVSKLPIIAPTSRLLLPTPLSLQPDASTTELDLCYHVRVYTVLELANSLAPTEFWQKYALPLSHTYQPVESAICALGSAHKYFKRQDQMDLVTRQTWEEASVGQYNRAIRAAYQYTSSSERTLEVILTCCLIFICIENLHGRYENALRHLESAFSLLNASYQRGGLESSTTPGQQQDLTVFLGHIGSLLCGLASDMLFCMDDDISTKLVSGLIAWVEAQHPVDLEDTMTAFPSAQAAALALVRLQSICDAELCADSCSSSDGDSCHASASDCDSGDWLIQTLFDAWNARFRAFRAQFDHNMATKSEIHRVKILDPEQVTWEATMKQDSVNDDLDRSDCEKILQKAESLILVESTGLGRTFCFDGHLVPPVSLVIISCPDPDIQWKGVSLLRSMHRREGIWDSEEMARVYTTMITAKEKKLVSWGDIPGMCRA